MQSAAAPTHRPAALTLLSSERPRDVGWRQAAGLLFGDWGTSRLYVLGLALFFAGRTSFWLIVMMSGLILGVGWAYAQICRIYPDGGGVYTAAKRTSRILAVIGALLVFADYTVTASLSVLDAFHYFGLPLHRHIAAAGEESKLTEPVRLADDRYNIKPNIDAGETRHQTRNPAGPEGTPVCPRFARPVGDRRHRGYWPVQHDGAQAHGRLRAGGGGRNDFHHAVDHGIRAAAGVVARAAQPASAGPIFRIPAKCGLLSSRSCWR